MLAAFREAAAAVAASDREASTDEKLALYGLFKQATRGDAPAAGPGVFDVAGAARWRAWARHRGSPARDARAAYVVLAQAVLGEGADSGAWPPDDDAADDDAAPAAPDAAQVAKWADCLAHYASSSDGDEPGGAADPDRFYFGDEACLAPLDEPPPFEAEEPADATPPPSPRGGGLTIPITAALGGASPPREPRTRRDDESRPRRDDDPAFRVSV